MQNLQMYCMSPPFVNCTNTALPSRILILAMFTLHNFCEDMFPHRPGGPHETYMELELTVPVAPSLRLTPVLPLPSYLWPSLLPHSSVARVCLETSIFLDYYV
jgi:hypothetical protein